MSVDQFHIALRMADSAGHLSRARRRAVQGFLIERAQTAEERRLAIGAIKKLSRNYRHGLSRYPEYSIWQGMLARCGQRSTDGHADYAGRGIRACEHWLIFENFFIDMGRRPSPDHSLERRDNNGPYDPKNCVWATTPEQCYNKRSTRKYEVLGGSYSMLDLEKLTGIPRDRLRHRVYVRGWSIEKAVSTPYHQRLNAGPDDRPNAYASECRDDLERLGVVKIR